MQPSLIHRPDQRVPRYTSYPTAPHFHEGIAAPTYRGWLRTTLQDGEPLSLYVHIPYCRELCWYCGCNTRATRRYEPVRDYVETLKAEISHVAGAIETKPVVTHLHWGGGTPTILAADDFTAVTEQLKRSFQFAGDAEIAIEIDPRALAPDTLDAMVAAGITRASVGVQDFNLHVQMAINRIQPFDVVAEAVAALRKAGIAQINFDLMYGLPSQTVADVRWTIKRAHSLQPDRLAVFGYAHVPWMKKHQNMINNLALPTPEDRLEQATAIAEELTLRGYRRIGLDHFAREGDELALALDQDRLRRNFQGYTTDTADSLLGFGASAISTLPAGYVQNHSDYGRYARAVEQDGLAIARGVETNRDDQCRRAIIERLMCTLGVDLDRVSDAFGADPSGFTDELETLRNTFDDRLVKVDGACVRVTEPGRPWLRAVCAVFDTYLQQSKARHSGAV